MSRLELIFRFYKNLNFSFFLKKKFWPWKCDDCVKRQVFQTPFWRQIVANGRRLLREKADTFTTRVVNLSAGRRNDNENKNKWKHFQTKENDPLPPLKASFAYSMRSWLIKRMWFRLINAEDELKEEMGSSTDGWWVLSLIKSADRVNTSGFRHCQTGIKLCLSSTIYTLLDSSWKALSKIF